MALRVRIGISNPPHFRGTRPRAKFLPRADGTRQGGTVDHIIEYIDLYYI